MWEEVKSVLCYFCRRDTVGKDEETSQLLGEDSSAYERGYQKVDCDCEPCDTCDISDKRIQIQEIEVNFCESELPRIEAARTLRNFTKFDNGNSFLSKKEQVASSENMNYLTPMDSGDHVLSNINDSNTNLPIRAAASVSGIVSANSPLWKQMESINSVFDDRPPTLN